MIKAIAIDDEPIALEIIRSMTDKVPFIELQAVFTNAFQALDYLQKENIDLLFLDIKMPDISGIEFYNSLRKKHMVIFTTAYSEHAVASFELDAIDYLLKPFSLARFVKACNKAFELYQLRNAAIQPDYFFLKTGYEQQKILYEDILYLEASGNYTTFVLKNRSILSRLTFSEAAETLPADKFVRIHRSYIVAINKIDKIEKSQLTVNSKILPVSEAYTGQLDNVLRKNC